MLAPRLFLIFGLALARPNAPDKIVNMNGDYLISNPNPSSPKQFSTEYSTYPDVKYFDAYSPPIQSRYGEVYWTMMDPVPLDKDIVDQFHGKTMAIVGYESDQVMKTDNGDVSVPIIWAYNHHFEAYLSGSYSEMMEVDGNVIYSYNDVIPRGMNSHGATKFSYPFPRLDVNDPTPDSHVPISQFFSEGNGGEFRKSYHGYPHGFAQLIDSPTTFHIQPMQIDTRNRDYNGSDFRAGIMPKSSAAPPNASYSVSQIPAKSETIKYWIYVKPPTLTSKTQKRCFVMIFLAGAACGYQTGYAAPGVGYAAPWSDALMEELGRPSLLTAAYLGERPNHGCGPNPLLQLVREMPHWLQQSLRAATSGTSGDMLRGIRSDGAALQEFLQFKRTLRRFKDCIRTADGVRAKKSQIPVGRSGAQKSAYSWAWEDDRE